MTRRGLELFLARFPDASPPKQKWKLPKIHSGGVRAPLEKLHDIAAGMRNGAASRADDLD